jgi:hypothetical protein
VSTPNMTAFSQMTMRHRALVRCDATGRNDQISSLCSRCVTCGAPAYDWRRLLGVGARVAGCTANPRSMSVTYPGACGDCGGCELVVYGLGAD